MFLSNGSMIRRPRFPPLAPAGDCSPVSRVPSRRSDFLPPIPPALRCLRLAVPREHSFRFAPDTHRVLRCAGLELVTRYLQPGFLPRRRQDLPSSWGTPIVRLRMFFDADRTACTRPVRSSNMAPAGRTTKAPAKGLSTLNSMAFGLAVYASQHGLPRHHARLASGRWSDATGRASHPQGSVERFQFCFLTSHPPFPSFAWRNRPPPKRPNAAYLGRVERRRAVDRQKSARPPTRGVAESGPPTLRLWQLWCTRLVSFGLPAAPSAGTDYSPFHAFGGLSASSSRQNAPFE